MPPPSCPAPPPLRHKPLPCPNSAPTPPYTASLLRSYYGGTIYHRNSMLRPGRGGSAHGPRGDSVHGSVLGLGATGVGLNPNPAAGPLSAAMSLREQLSRISGSHRGGMAPSVGGRGTPHSNHDSEHGGNAALAALLAAGYELGGGKGSGRGSRGKGEASVRGAKGEPSTRGARGEASTRGRGDAAAAAGAAGAAAGSEAGAGPGLGPQGQVQQAVQQGWACAYVRQPSADCSAFPLLAFIDPEQAAAPQGTAGQSTGAPGAAATAGRAVGSGDRGSGGGGAGTSQPAPQGVTGSVQAHQRPGGLPGSLPGGGAGATRASGEGRLAAAGLGGAAAGALVHALGSGSGMSGKSPGPSGHGPSGAGSLLGLGAGSVHGGMSAAAAAAASAAGLPGMVNSDASMHRKMLALMVLDRAANMERTEADGAVGGARPAAAALDAYTGGHWADEEETDGVPPMASIAEERLSARPGVPGKQQQPMFQGPSGQLPSIREPSLDLDPSSVVVSEVAAGALRVCLQPD